MATVTTNPRRRLSKIPAARSYASVASRYADTFQKAIDAQEANDLNTKLNLFRLGQMSYADFKSFLEQKIKDAPGGSKKQADYTGLMIDAEKYNEQLQVDKINNLKTQMLDKIQGNVTTKDELNIVRELKKTVDPSSKAYQSLVDSEVTLKQKVATEGKGAGKSALADQLQQYYTAIEVDNAKIADDFKKGLITGAEADQQLYDNGQNLKQAMIKASAGGVDIPAPVYKTVDEANQITAQRLAQREVGQVFDVINNQSGQVQSVTHQELLNDKNSTSPNFTQSRYSIEPDASGRRFTLVDTQTGKPVTYEGSTTARSFDTTAKAKTAADALQGGNDFSVSVPQRDPNTGLMTAKKYSFDPQSQTFAPVDNVNLKTYTPSPGQEQKFAPDSFSKTLGDFFNNGIVKIKNYLNPTDNSINLTGLKQELNPAVGTGTTGPFMGPANKPVTTPTPVSTTTQTAEFNPPKNNFISKVANIINPPKTPTITPPGNMPSPTGNIDLSGTNLSGFKMPDLKIPEFNLPGFNLNSTFNTPNPSFNPPSSNGPTMGPSSSGAGFLDKIKSFGQSAIGGIKNFFGF